jgi:NifU-like protein involved in Fe-S cluster formation
MCRDIVSCEALPEAACLHWKFSVRGAILHGTMLDDVYNKQILSYAADIPRLGRLESPDGTATAHSKLCGSKVTVDIKLKDGVISDFAHDVKACALGQASSSMMARLVVGSTPEEIYELRDQMHAMLKHGGPPPTGKWACMEALTPVRDFKARHASTLLTFDATCAALDMALGKPEAQDKVQLA